MKLSGVFTFKKGSEESKAANADTIHQLKSPLSPEKSPKDGFTLLHGDAPPPKYLMKLYSQAAANNQEVNLITVTVPLQQFSNDVTLKVACSLEKSRFLETEHLRVSSIAKDLRNELVDRLVRHYEEIEDLDMVEKLSSVNSSMAFNQFLATHTEVVDVLWKQNEHLAVITHFAEVDGTIQEVSTMYRGGLDATVVNRHGKHKVELPEVCHRPILSIIRQRALNNEHYLTL
jgi:hypothetical protein